MNWLRFDNVYHLISEFKQRGIHKFISEAYAFFDSSPMCHFYRHRYDSFYLQFCLDISVNYRYVMFKIYIHIKCINPYYHRNPSAYKLIQLLSLRNVKTQENICTILRKAEVYVYIKFQDLG